MNQLSRVQTRPIDRIDTGPRFVQADVDRLNQLYDGADARELLGGVLHDHVAGDVALVSSFGADSAVLLHLAASVDRATPVLFLETGKHFPETLVYRDLLIDRLGLTGVVDLIPDPELLAERDGSGLRWSYDPDGCCDIRKVLPLAHALAQYDATITGRKGYQAATRIGLPRFEIDRTDSHGRIKINPLIDWGSAMIATYFTDYDLPAHPLVAQGYPSIGCSPCTSKVAPGEDPRAGRWRGWAKVECGIHVPGQPHVPGDVPPGFDPVL